MIWLAIAIADPPSPEAVAQLCAGRTPCQYVGHQGAGTDASGRYLQVVEVMLADGDPAFADAPAFGGPCVPLEHHLLRTEGDTIVDHRLLTETCNDGYGASGVGEDRFDVDDNRFHHEQSGGSSWRWSQGRTERLWPALLLEESALQHFSPMGSETATRWSWETLSGESTTALVRCGGPEEADTVDGFAVLLPMVPAWPGAAAGPCAAQVDSGDARGLVVFGTPGDPRDASMAVALTPDGLRIDVQDDTFVGDAARWIHADHVEIWVAAGPDPSAGYCVEPWEAVQWGVMLDGTVHAGRGEPDPTSLTAVVTRDADGAHVHVTFASGPPDALTVVYSDSDDGRSQERLLATSTLRAGDAHSLSPVKDLRSTGVCTPEGVVRHRWSPPVPGLLGERLSNALLEAQLAMEAATSAEALVAAWRTSRALVEPVQERAQEVHDARGAEALLTLQESLPGWRLGMAVEGEQVGASLDPTPWRAAATRTDSLDDDALFALLERGWGDASMSGRPTWLTPMEDGRGCHDLGDGELLALLLASDALSAETLAGERDAVRRALIDAIVVPLPTYPFCVPGKPKARTAKALDAEVEQILDQVQLSSEERARLEARRVEGF